ncbi:MAG: hypothetical protein U0V74_16175 [Chitinophagales bacterium]
MNEIRFSLTTAFFSLLALGLVGVSSCAKDPGTGGLASISGRVYAYDYNTYNELVDSGYLADENVYISYGDHTTVDDNVKTNYNGEFKFEWLQKGDYSLWVYTKCDSCTLGQDYVMQKVTITKRKENAVLPEFVIKK